MFSMRRIAVVSLAIVPVVAAAEPDYSVFAGVNHSRLETILLAGDTRLTLADDYTDFGGRLGGAVAWKWLGLEVGWADLGSTRGTVELGIDCPGGCPPGQAPSIDDERQRGSALWAAITPMYRTASWTVAGKIGMARTRIHRDVVNGGSYGSSSSSELLIGAGAEYALAERWGLRFGMERIGSDATSAGLSVAYHF